LQENTLPALFVYLVAVMLLLSGGYGALNWLAAPEPIKVAVKVKPKAVPHYEVIPPIADSSGASTTASSATNPPAVDESKDTASRDTTSEQTASATSVSEPLPGPANNQPEIDSRAGMNKQASEQIGRDNRPAALPEPARDSKIRAARAEAPAAGPRQIASETKGEASKDVQPPSPSRPERQQTSGRPQTVASVDSAAATKPVNRPRLNQTSRRSERPVPAERRPLALMTLRTIEFPDGRRETRLIPYRDAERNLDD
jgi:hypothetical protein